MSFCWILPGPKEHAYKDKLIDYLRTIIIMMIDQFIYVQQQLSRMTTENFSHFLTFTSIIARSWTGTI